MAISSKCLLLLTILLPLLSIAAAGRPCKSILFISTSSQNPNSQSGRSITVFITGEINPIYSDLTESEVVEKPQLPSEVQSSVTDSFRERTVDIMSVVGALLFGVGCGALTAASMYCIWSLFSPAQFYDYEESEFEDDASLKKIGYVAIPSVTTKQVE